jgi:preprotein translocase subunit SecE
MFNYFRDVRSEMRHVAWPSRPLIIAYTAVVVGVSLGVAIYLGLLDYVFRVIIEQIISH